MVMSPWIEAIEDAEAPGFKAAAEATRVDAAEVQIMQVGVTSCV